MTAIVTGIMRTGTSLMMQILDKSGMECLGEYPYFEHGVAKEHGFINSAWVKGTKGKAWKFLESGLRLVRNEDLPEDTKFIWMQRGTKETLNSWMKFYSQLFPDMAEGELKRHRAVFKEDIPKSRRFSLDYIKAFGYPILKVRFEDLIKNPSREIERVSEFLEIEGKREEMLSAVEKRSEKCLKNMLEADLMKGRK